MKHKIQALIRKYPHRFTIISFTCGFLFDIAMVSNVDDWHAIVQQAVYLGILLAFLLHELKRRDSQTSDADFQVNPPPSVVEIGKFQRLKDWLVFRSELIAHFLLGTLLNVYSIFFFKSASFVASLGFFFFMLLLLVANELHQLRRFGFSLRFSLWTLCLISFSVILSPVLIGKLSLMTFALGILFALMIWTAIFWYAKSFQNFRGKEILPSFGIFIVFITMYALQLLPPVPLSAKEVAIYYKVEKQADQYRVETLKPWWKFWLRGDQEFYARPGDKISLFARINAPSGFHDQMQLRWQYQDPHGRWATSDTIPFSVAGGREHGFRGHAFKENYFAGKWRVLLEASDGREVSRLDFDVIQDPSQNTERDFQTLFK